MKQAERPEAHAHAVAGGREAARGVDAYLMGQTALPSSPDS